MSSDPMENASVASAAAVSGSPGTLVTDAITTNNGASAVVMDAPVDCASSLPLIAMPFPTSPSVPVPDPQTGKRWFYYYGDRAWSELVAYETFQRVGANSYGDLTSFLHVPQVEMLGYSDHDGRPTLCVRRLYVPGRAAHTVPDLSRYFHHDVRGAGLAQALAAMVAVDYYLGNDDRHEGNWLLTDALNIAPIDTASASDPFVALTSVLRPFIRVGLLRDRQHGEPMAMHLAMCLRTLFDPVVHGAVRNTAMIDRYHTAESTLAQLRLHTFATEPCPFA